MRFEDRGQFVESDMLMPHVYEWLNGNPFGCLESL